MTAILFNNLSCKRFRYRKSAYLSIAVILFCAATIYYMSNRPRYKYEFDYVKIVSAPDVSNAFSAKILNRKISVALALAITTRTEHVDEHIESSAVIPKQSNITVSIKELPVFVDLVPSFCLTGSTGFIYSIFVAFDVDDPILATKPGQELFENNYKSVLKRFCSESLNPVLHFVHCAHSGKPAQAQNDAVLAAYKLGVDFIYRVNDDTSLATSQWTEIFITSLYQFNPPLIGVVGPARSAKVENRYILTYEFVHRSHIDIFGYHYPSDITTWFGDDWISHVYQPGRALCLKDVHVEHTQTMGRRYAVHSDILLKLDALLTRDKKRLQSWIINHYSNHSHSLSNLLK